MKPATVVKIDDKTFHVMLGQHCIGVAKTDFDARHHMYVINYALEVAYLEGQKTLERMVVKQRLDLEMQHEELKAQAERAVWRADVERKMHEQTSGPQCVKCGAFTTKTRVETHGLCMKCEGEQGL